MSTTHRSADDALQQRPAVQHLLAAADHANAGRNAEAENEFAKALLLEPTLAIARFQLGLLQFVSGRHAMGLLTWTPLLEPGQPTDLADFVQGCAALAACDIPLATSHFERAIAACSNAALVHDMEKLLAAARAAAMAVEHAAQADEDPSDPAGHVLLANYVRNGTLH